MLLDLLIHLAAAILGLVFIVGPLAFTVAAVLAFVEDQRRHRRVLREVTAEVRDETKGVGR